MNAHQILYRNSVYFFNEKSIRPNSPIVVIGPARGGTSMVATVLDALGYYLGVEAQAPVFESIEDSRVFLGKNHKSAIQLAKARSESHYLWAWKRPEAIESLNKVEKRLEPAAYLFVFRDPLATAIRRTKSSHGADESDLAFVLSQVSKVLEELEAIVSFAKRTKKPVALISYDSVLLDPKEFVSSLAAFLRLDIDSHKLILAATKVTPSPLKYLTETRSSVYQGRLDKVKDNAVIGWARMTEDDRPCQIEVSLNGELAAVITADKSRPDLERNGLGNCAFRHVFEDSLSVGDVISVRIVGDDLDLINSPFTVKNL